MSDAQLRFKRADRLYHGAVRLGLLFGLIMLFVLVWQVANLQGDFSSAQTAELKRQEVAREESRKRLDKALAETNRQQVVTQNYIRCVASVLLQPIAERTESDFDACGIPGVTDPAKLGQPNTNQGTTAPNQQTPAVTPQAITPTAPSAAEPNNQPTTSGPPPDDDDRSVLGRLPLVGGLLDGIGL